MSVQPLARSTMSRRRRSWLLFWGASAAAVGACVLATLRSSGTTGAGLALLGSLIVVGIAAALMESIISPSPDHLDARRGGGGDFGGGGDSGGGDCGG